MKLGGIYYFPTTQAVGHASRFKYHLYLGEGNWSLDGRIFMFINKLNGGGCYRITKVDYNFLTLPESWINCNELIAYSDTELDRLNITLHGRLKKSHLSELHDHIAECETLTGHSIKLACDLIKKLI